MGPIRALRNIFFYFNFIKNKLLKSKTLGLGGHKVESRWNSETKNKMAYFRQWIVAVEVLTVGFIRSWDRLLGSWPLRHPWGLLEFCWVSSSHHGTSCWRFPWRGARVGLDSPPGIWPSRLLKWTKTTNYCVSIEAWRRNFNFKIPTFEQLDTIWIQALPSCRRHTVNDVAFSQLSDREQSWHDSGDEFIHRWCVDGHQVDVFVHLLPEEKASVS